VTPHAKIQSDRANGDVPANGRDITHVVFSLKNCDENFCSHPETTAEAISTLFDSHGVNPRLFHSWGIKLPKISVSPFLRKNTP